MARSVPEWIGSTPDAPIPPRVRLRVFEKYNGVCHISGRRIKAGEPWDCDHIIALINGGEHRESNLAPALSDKHREKTKEDVAQKSKNYKVRSKAVGINLRPSRPKIQSRGFAPAAPQRSASRPIQKGIE